MINDLKTFNGLKIHLTMKMNFMSSKDSDKKRFMHSKSNNEEMMTSFDIEELYL